MRSLAIGCALLALLLGPLETGCTVVRAEMLISSKDSLATLKASASTRAPYAILDLPARACACANASLFTETFSKCCPLMFAPSKVMQMRCCDNEKECLNESDNPARISRSDDVMLTAKRAALGTFTEGCISVFFWTLLFLCTHDFLINIAPGFLLQSPVARTCSHIPATMLAKSSASESGGLALVDKKQGRGFRTMCMEASWACMLVTRSQPKGLCFQSGTSVQLME